jgi:hypothetical protein
MNAATFAAVREPGAAFRITVRGVFSTRAI